VHGVPTDPLSNVYARRTLPLSIPTPDPLRPDPFRSFPRRNSTRRRYWYPSRSPALLCRPLLGFAPDPSPRSNSSPRCRREEQLGEEDSQYQRLGEGACSRPSMCMCSSPVGQEANLISLSPSLSLSLSLSLSIQMVGFNAQGCHRTAACPPTRRGGASGGRDGERSHRAKQLRSSGRAAPRPAPGGSGGDRRRGAEQPQMYMHRLPMPLHTGICICILLILFFMKQDYCICLAYCFYACMNCGQVLITSKNY
jgi:hypothetical protein